MASFGLPERSHSKMLSQNIIVYKLTNHQKTRGFSTIYDCVVTIWKLFFLPGSSITATKRTCSSGGPGDSLSRTGRGLGCLHPMAVGARTLLGGHKEQVRCNTHVGDKVAVPAFGFEKQIFDWTLLFLRFQDFARHDPNSIQMQKLIGGEALILKGKMEAILYWQVRHVCRYHNSLVYDLEQQSLLTLMFHSPSFGL